MIGPTLPGLLQLAETYRLPPEEVFLIALNRCGLNATLEDHRVRFVLRLPDGDEFFLAVCVNTGATPFFLSDGGDISLAGARIASAVRLEQDTCDSTYFRRRGTELTLNSNARSLCAGCTFCGTHSMNAQDQQPLCTPDDLRRYLTSLLRSEGLQDLSHLVRVTLCTGCFADETKVVDNILMVRDVLAEVGFAKRIRYIGAQIGMQGLTVLKRHLDAFSLSYTVECFARRAELLHPAKSRQSLEGIYEILSEARSIGFATNFLYVMGLDTLHDAEAGFELFKNAISRFPVVQILQRYTKNRAECGVPAAEDITYFLRAREMVERVYGDCCLRPRVWENYRGLWYLTYGGRTLDCLRM
jgi:hypothetical protein